MNDNSGKIQTKGGVNYTGSFIDGKRQGKGAVTTNNGTLEGQFKDD